MSLQNNNMTILGHSLHYLYGIYLSRITEELCILNQKKKKKAVRKNNLVSIYILEFHGKCRFTFPGISRGKFLFYQNF